MNATTKRILIWDLPTRVFHWTLVVCFIGAILTKESERYRLFHVTFGYTMMGLVVFRIVWGLIGTKYAKFSSFFFAVKQVKQYLEGLLRKRPVHYLGHNPLGSIAIYLILTSVLVISVSGYCIYNDIGPNWYAKAHEISANFLIGLVLIHIFGVAISSLFHQENLVSAMITGFKQGAVQDAIKNHFLLTYLALAIIVSIGYFWFYQFGLH